MTTDINIGLNRKCRPIFFVKARPILKQATGLIVSLTHIKLWATTFRYVPDETLQNITIKMPFKFSSFGVSEQKCNLMVNGSK